MDSKKLDYVKRNIIRLNSPKVKEFLDEEGVSCPFPNVTELGYFLQEKFHSEIEKFIDVVWDKWKKNEFTTVSITNIANEYVWSKSNLEKYLQFEVKNKMLNHFKSSDFSLLFDKVLEIVKSECNQMGFRLVKNDFENVLRNSFQITLQCGFPSNNYNINSGVMIANAGDSAQFLFVARAILIGLNCSNVDVRSSRYDAIVDYQNKLFRIQVKGVSGTTISFKDRDRGGQGIDSTHDRNKGKRITSKDCDVYVAVDKSIGICYLIPMIYVESLKDDEIASVSLKSVSKYKEYWNVFDDLLNLTNKL